MGNARSIQLKDNLTTLQKEQFTGGGDLAIPISVQAGPLLLYGQILFHTTVLNQQSIVPIINPTELKSTHSIQAVATLLFILYGVEPHYGALSALHTVVEGHRSWDGAIRFISEWLGHDQHLAQKVSVKMPFYWTLCKSHYLKSSLWNDDYASNDVPGRIGGEPCLRFCLKYKDSSLQLHISRSGRIYDAEFKEIPTRFGTLIFCDSMLDAMDTSSSCSQDESSDDDRGEE